MRALILAVLLLVAAVATGYSESGTELIGRESDRMLRKCPKESEYCRRLVEQYESISKTYFELMDQKRNAQAMTYLQAASGMSRIIRNQFPEVWAARNCPRGDCRSVLEQLLGQQ